MKQYMKFADHLDGDTGPEDVVVVLDTSSSMTFDDYPPSRADAAKEAGAALLDVKRGRYPSDRVGIVGFGCKARVIHPLATMREGRASLKQALHNVESDGSTNITAGLKKAAALLDSSRSGEPQAGTGVLSRISRLLFEDSAAPAHPMTPHGNARIILLSDGKHNTGPRPEPVAEKLKEQGVVIDVLGIGGSPTAEEFDEDQLKQIASMHPDGSPRYCFIGDVAQLIKKFESLAHHIRPLGA